ncbi:hypothetical protein WICPIJ_006806 [Wickerhamomyces pijperi]|uniref:Uncharacterized protein n=1 Tax=Wickerhamomyces pijperi TaxID=599730 RepID=A0A9P8Q343_WICPI|nr:hypothetical protein WICPIJ_006806 [Wickerhamomyces pijperi]
MILSPAGDSTKATTFLETGSNGWNSITLYLVKAALARGYWARDFKKALSMASRPFFFLAAAKVAVNIKSSASTPATVYGSCKDNLFLVKVPVLSEHKISTPAKDSMADNFWTMACFLANTNTVQDFSEVTGTTRGLVD